MDPQMDFRSLLLKLQERLSERDRRHLHFLLGDVIPRQLRNDPSIGGTLELLETLFDQAKINDQDFTYLIQAFREIGCFEIVKRLEMHQKTQEQRKLPTNLPMIKELFNDNEYDKITSAVFSSNSSDSPDPTSFLLISNSSSTKEKPSPRHGFHVFNRTENNSFFRSQSLSKLKTFLVASLSLNVLLFVFLCIGYGHLKTPQSSLPTTNNEVKEGPAYGGNSEIVFNDAVYLSGICKSRCVGVEVHWRRDFLYSIRFLYDQNLTQSPPHHGRDGGTHQSSQEARFLLKNDEEIMAITLYTGTNEDFEHGTINFILGIQFHTNHGRESDLYGSTNGDVLTESFPGYTFAYAKGRAGLVVDQLQFVWCNMCPTSSVRLDKNF